MLPSVLTRPVRVAQHTALSALHTGLNLASSVISTVRGGGNGDGPPVPAPNPAPPRTAPEVSREENAPVAEDTAPAKKAPSAKKASTKKAPTKKAPAKKASATKAPEAKKSAPAGKTPSSVPSPADVAERVGAAADEPEHVEVEEVLAYSTGPDVSTTVADEVVADERS